MKKNWALWLIALIIVLSVGYAGYKYTQSGVGNGAVVPTPIMTSTPATASPQVTATAGAEFIKTKSSSTLGAYLTDPKGMTLYIFTKDAPNVSNCNDGCATTWPPYLAPSNGGTLPADITVFKRNEGTWQYAWAGKPLYYYAGDKAPGDTTGQGIGGIWFVAKP